MEEETRKKVKETDKYLSTQHKDRHKKMLNATVNYGTDLCVASTNLRSSL